MLVLDLIYLLVAQVNFAQTTSKLAASAMAVSPHRRPTRAARIESSANRALRNSGKGDGHV
ncbi:hypothetical protein NHF46_22340 [Arthrobacter alpinus]|nr:hypothetical protein [Arthrobacter alpinus]